MESEWENALERVGDHPVELVLMAMLPMLGLLRFVRTFNRTRVFCRVMFRILARITELPPYDHPVLFATESPFHVSRLMSITCLRVYCEMMGVVDLGLLTRLHHLHTLELIECFFENGSCIPLGLTSLTRLVLIGTQLTIGPLPHNLRSLNLESFTLFNLTTLVQLTELRLARTVFWSDALITLTALRHLSLESLTIVDVSGSPYFGQLIEQMELASLTLCDCICYDRDFPNNVFGRLPRSLTALNITDDGFRPSTIARNFLGHLTALTRLRICVRTSGIGMSEFPTSLTNLEDLTLEEDFWPVSMTSDLAFVSHLPRLHRLTLTTRNAASGFQYLNFVLPLDLEHLSFYPGTVALAPEMTHLTSLDIEAGNFPSFPLPHLRSLCLYWTRGFSLTRLAPLVRLTRLELASMAVYLDGHALSQLTTLEHLIVPGRWLSVSTFQPLTRLTYLELPNYTRFEDVSSLVCLTSLRYLDMRVDVDEAKSIILAFSSLIRIRSPNGQIYPGYTIEV